MKRIFKNLMLIGFATTLCVACDKEEDDGIITKGTFTVAQGKKVYFSQGNLQYQASTNTWRFAEHQYDIVGENYEKLSSSYDGWIDLFGYGTSGWNSDNHIYQPYSSYFWTYDLTGNYANADWGVYNKISNGGNKAGLWRTLTYSEWYYLLFSRPHYANLYSKGRVDGIRGLILLPDDWQISEKDKFTPNGKNWDTNDYTVTEWRKLEAKGAIFLPAAGKGTVSERLIMVDRDETILTIDVNGQGYEGYYWSSTVWNYLSIYGELESRDNPFVCYSVRLVQDVK